MNIHEAAGIAWDGWVGAGTTEEMMEGHATPEEAIAAYCDDWPFRTDPEAGGPDDEQADLMGYTPRQLLILYLELHEDECSA